MNFAVYFMGECVFLAETKEEADAAVGYFDDTSGFEIIEITDENRERILEDYGD